MQKWQKETAVQTKTRSQTEQSYFKMNSNLHLWEEAATGGAVRMQRLVLSWIYTHTSGLQKPCCRHLLWRRFWLMAQHQIPAVDCTITTPGRCSWLGCFMSYGPACKCLQSLIYFVLYSNHGKVLSVYIWSHVISLGLFALTRAVVWL